MFAKREITFLFYYEALQTSHTFKIETAKLI
jgi:hypothetical protein